MRSETCARCIGPIGRGSRRGYCHVCYRGGLKDGTLDREVREPEEDRFWRNVNKNGRQTATADGPCWEWTACVDGPGYGFFRGAHNELIRTHRWSWQKANGPITNRLHILHKCDNPPCVRPDHLFIGTMKDNMVDRNAKMRHAFGERAGRAVLTTDIVLSVRSLYREGHRIKDIAARIGFHGNPQALYHAAVGRTWKHLPMVENEPV